MSVLYLALSRFPSPNAPPSSAALSIPHCIRSRQQLLLRIVSGSFSLISPLPYLLDWCYGIFHFFPSCDMILKM
nr:MAG TPA: hypothetical protein [Caudoviricetes sp.]